MDHPETDESLESVAIIGMACRFPEARNPEEFWKNLRDGKECVSFFTDEELTDAGADPELLNDPGYVRAAAILEDIDIFDAAFFGFSPREAAITDPQHRLFLECAWEVMESAGYDPERFRDRIGVYAGVGMSTYLFNILTSDPEFARNNDLRQLAIGSNKDYLTTRVSYKLNLKGPSVNVNTACSTSLVAVHLACRSLMNFDCDMALAGGVTIVVPQKSGYVYEESGILSPDGRCRAFDAQAKGTAVGSGLGIVLLKRLEDALNDGDTIHAIIRGSDINNDGASKMSYTAPSVEGQAQVITEAQIMAGVDPETITYIEAHGTGTTLGDPIEIEALTQAFQAGEQPSRKKNFCAIGSVKSNIGHLDTAAGISGLIKTVLAMRHRMIPPSINFEQPNPQIPFDDSPFYVNARLSQWKTDGHPLRAGVSSFGIGGTNAHLVLEESPEIGPSGKSRPRQLILLSAKTLSALDTATLNLADHLKQHPELNLADAAYTLQKGRKAFPYRRISVCQDIEDAESILRNSDPKQVLTNFHNSGRQSVIFMFSGQGAQYVNMGLELWQTEPAFREQIDQCSEILKPLLGLDLRHVLYPSETRDKQQAASGEETGPSPLTHTTIAQPALFVIEYALARLWMEWGIRPKAMIGHSIGEYTAACLAGVFSLEDALSLVVARGQMMGELPEGAMIAVPLSEIQIEPFMNERLSLAAVNGPSLCVVSGPSDAVDALQEKLAQQDIQCRRLHTSHAFHSRMTDPILPKFIERVRQIRLNPPRIPYISNVTGEWMTPADATEPEYWARHLRQTVRFSDGLRMLLDDPNQNLLEVGPGRTLTTFAIRHPDKTPEHTVLNSLRHPNDSQSDAAFILTTLGKLWLSGASVDWTGFHAHEQRHRVPLPTYPFERQRYWIDTKPRKFDPALSLPKGIKGSEIIAPDTFRPGPDFQKEYVGPRDETEQTVAELWKKLLGIGQVGIHDNFFEMGGDSLTAVRMINQIQKELSAKVDLTDIYESPTVEELAGMIRSKEVSAYAAIEKVPDADYYPLSHAQRRLWILRQFDGTDSSDIAYNISAALNMRGELNLSALELAFANMLQRHESLRAIFTVVDGEPCQKIHEKIDFQVEFSDLTAKDQPETSARQIATEHAEKPFDLEKGPLFSVSLLKLSDSRHVMLVNMSHIISDGWSVGVMIREFCQLYEAFSPSTGSGTVSTGSGTASTGSGTASTGSGTVSTGSGTVSTGSGTVSESPLRPLPIQYRDYAVWQRNLLESDEIGIHRAYWREKLSGEIPVLDFPGDYPRPPVQTFNGKTLFFTLSQEQTRNFGELARKQGVSLFMTLLATVKVLFFRYTGQEDIIIGSPTAGRFHADLEDQIGYYLNTLALRDRIQREESFVSFLRQVGQTATEAFDHQVYPFDRLVDELGLRHDLSRSPLFDVMLILQNTEAVEFSLKGLEITEFDRELRTSKLDLTFNFVEMGEDIRFDIEYNTDLFREDRISRMAGHFLKLTDSILADPNRPVADLDILSDAERRQLLYEYNDTDANYPPGRTVTDLFEEHAEKSPDNTAVVFEETRLSYRELNEQANRIAHFLTDEYNIQPDDRVGLLLDRSERMIAGILGILKAGGAYVPMEPTYPPERIRHITRDSACKAVLTDSCVSVPLPQDTETADISGIRHENTANPPRAASPNHLAYVIYTSGSTGVPKGVLTEHRSLYDYVMTFTERFGVTSGDRFLQQTTVTFDASVEEIYPPLCTAAPLFLCANSRELDALFSDVVRRGITILSLSPAAVGYFNTRAGELRDLRVLISGGDVLHGSSVTELLGKTNLYNTYGPTEATVCAAYHRIESPDDPVPIGRPIANRRIYILDAGLNPVPEGVFGEICIAGAGTARGYLNRDDLTEEKFTSDPFRPGERMYRTGDLGRWLPDGTIEFAGRNDSQVKVRGYRIELGEIENRLLEHGDVGEAAVMAGEMGGEAVELAAYIVPRGASAEMNIKMLRDHLRKTLPDYMIPSHFVQMEELPLSPAGKIDRKSLPRPGDAGMDSGTEYVAPRDDAERRLAEIW
ncbi:amino acid adenylation domain-containing protein, partial [Desulfobacterales bacterium HSG2]|nr:amino acid adenylation domain-containing protein [Desulfobacterales bacterium HSG2]